MIKYIIHEETLKAITDEKCFLTTLSSSFINEVLSNDSIFKTSQAVEVALLVRRVSGNRYWCEVKAKTNIRFDCSRCLEESELKMEVTFQHVFGKKVLGADPDSSQADEALDFSLFNTEIDFVPIISEHILIELPIKPLCKEDCKGLCAQCGANQNTNPCQCNKDLNKSAFSELKIKH